MYIVTINILLYYNKVPSDRISDIHFVAESIAFL